MDKELEAFMLLIFFFQSGCSLPTTYKHKIMQDKKIQCILLQSESDRQGDIPITVEKMGTLTHYEVGYCRKLLQLQCTVPVSLKNFLR